MKMKLLALIALFLAWLAIDHACTLTEAHSPAPTAEQWTRLRAAHHSNLAD